MSRVKGGQLARAAGIHDFNIDLIVGLAGQTPESWERSLDATLALDPPHVSVYMLEIDEDSLRRESDFLVRCGAHGMVWPAGAGETNSISHAERIRFSESVVKEVKGRTTVLIGVHGANRLASNSLLEALVFAHRCAESISEKLDGLDFNHQVPDWNAERTSEPSIRTAPCSGLPGLLGTHAISQVCAPTGT